MRLINADELITAFPCGESVRTESVRATINHMPTIEIGEDCISRADAIKAYNEAVDELVKAEMEEFNLGDFTECSFNTTQLKLIARKIENAPNYVAFAISDVTEEMKRADTNCTE